MLVLTISLIYGAFGFLEMGVSREQVFGTSLAWVLLVIAGFDLCKHPAAPFPSGSRKLYDYKSGWKKFCALGQSVELFLQKSSSSLVGLLMAKFYHSSSWVNTNRPWIFFGPWCMLFQLVSPYHGDYRILLSWEQEDQKWRQNTSCLGRLTALALPLSYPRLSYTFRFPPAGYMASDPAPAANSYFHDL